MNTWSSLCASFAAFARAQEYVIGNIRAPYAFILQAAAHVVSYDPDVTRRRVAAVRAAGIAGDVMFRFLAQSGRLVVGEGGAEMPVGREAERFVIATSGLSVLFGDENFLAVAQAALGFSGSIRSRDALVSVLAPPLVGRGGSYVLGSSMQLLDEVLDHHDPAARLRQKAAMRSWRDAHPKPMRGGGQPLVSLGGLDTEIEAPVADEAAPMLTHDDWAWVADELRRSGRKRDERIGQALAAYHQAGFRKGRIPEADYRLLQREAHRPSRMGWLVLTRSRARMA